MECEFCKKPDKFEDFRIKDFVYWSVFLHGEQYYLGRSVIRLRRHVEDLGDLTSEEQKEFFIVARKLRNAIKGLFRADLINYAFLGNVTRHLHCHFIPRYAKPREFLCKTFTDKRWGQNYVPYPKKQLDQKQYKELIKVIKEKI